MKSLIPSQTSTPPITQPQPAPAPAPARPARPEPDAPVQSAPLRDLLGEAERAEDFARRERERAAQRQPAGLD